MISPQVRLYYNYNLWFNSPFWHFLNQNSSSSSILSTRSSAIITCLRDWPSRYVSMRYHISCGRTWIGNAMLAISTIKNKHAITTHSFKNGHTTRTRAYLFYEQFNLAVYIASRGPLDPSPVLTCFGMTSWLHRLLYHSHLPRIGNRKFLLDDRIGSQHIFLSKHQRRCSDLRCLIDKPLQCYSLQKYRDIIADFLSWLHKIESICRLWLQCTHWMLWLINMSALPSSQ